MPGAEKGEEESRVLGSLEGEAPFPKPLRCGGVVWVEVWMVRFGEFVELSVVHVLVRT